MNRMVEGAGIGLLGAAAFGLLLLAPASAQQRVEDAAALVGISTAPAGKATPRIDVGESKKFGYTTTCVNRKGKKIKEKLTVYLSGHPDTGGATARLKPKPVYTNQDFDIIISTTEETKPGAYSMTVSVYGGKKCGFIGDAQQALDVAPKIKVKDDAVVWWFKGQKPSGYDTSLKLFAMGPGGQPYEWRISRGGDKAKIGKKVSNTAEVEGVSPSDDRYDVSVRVSSGGVESDPFFLTVNAPHSLVFLRNVDKADATWGYETEIHYAIKDQFGRTLPSSVPINEHWTSGVTRQYSGTTWLRGPNGGAAQVVPSDWLDQVQGERTGAGHVPSPQAPKSPLGDVKIYRWDGEWSVGSDDPSGGKGARVSKNTWQRFRDHARHTNFVSPAP